jgi:hypothetical protein
MAKTDDNQERMEADRKTDRNEIKQEIRGGQEHMQEMIRTSQAIQAKTKAIQVETKVMLDKRMEPNMNDGRKERTARHEAAETDTEKIEPDPRIMQAVAEYKEVPKEDPQ